MSQNHFIYCLESVADCTAPSSSVFLPSLESLTLQYGITNVYATFDSIETFEERISTLLYEDRNYKDYAVLYLALEGKDNQIKVDNYYYSLEEIAEFFEGKLQGKMVHFANTMTLDLEEETFQYFLDVTGAMSISGYGNQIPIASTSLDNLFFAILEEEDAIVTIVEELQDKAFAMCKALGFRMYY